MHDPQLISDGYTRNGYIKAVPGRYGDLRFKYRPMPAVIRREYLFLINAALDISPETKTGDAAALINIAVKIVLRQCTDLSLSNEHKAKVPVVANGVAVPTAKALISKMEPNLMERLRDICLGVDLSDPEPEPYGQPQTPDDVDADALMRRLDTEEPAPTTIAARETLLEGDAAGN